MRFSDFQQPRKLIPGNIPRKYSSGGFTFNFDPATKVISVTYGGKRIGKFNYKGLGINDYQNVTDRIIRQFSHYQQKKIDAINAKKQPYNHPIQPNYTDQNSYNIALPGDIQSQIFQQHDVDTAQHGDVDVVNPGKWSAIRKRQKQQDQNEI